MKKHILIFFVIFPLFASDQDLEQLWSLIGDINSPTLEEYQKIDGYLSESPRPYLDLLRESDEIELRQGRMDRILNFRLVGPKNEMPIFGKYSFNTDENNLERCILLYSSSNGIYPNKAKKLLGEIENCGFCGHVLVRIGGFPNTEFGGLKICHIPYSFKVAFLEEARQLGYKAVLWIDLAIHPLLNFETIFREIERKGHFFTTVGTLADNFSSHLPEAARALEISDDLYGQIPHISSSMIGLNMENRRAIQLLETWYRETEKVIPSITWWPEELSLSAIAWRLGCKPMTWFGNFVCGESEQFQLENRPEVEFYLDVLR